MEWSNETILEFLALYEGEPSIWNPKHPHNKNRNLVHDAWKRIENNLSIKVSVTELKKKKETLMATFRKLIHKVKASGIGTPDEYKPDWFAYDFMNRFLHHVFKPNEVKSEYDSEVDETTQTSIASSTQKIFLNSTQEVIKPQSNKRKAVNDLRIQPSPENFSSDMNLKSSSQTTNHTGRDPSDIFAEYIAAKHRKYSDHVQSIVEHLVSNILFEADMGKYDLTQESNFLEPSCSIVYDPLQPK